MDALDYGMSRRPNTIWISAILAGFSLLFGSICCRLQTEPAAGQSRLQYLQQQCESYDASGSVAFDSDPTSQLDRATGNLVQFRGRQANLVLFRSAACLDGLIKAGNLFVDGADFPHAVLFLHNRQTDDGRNWIVVMLLSCQQDGNGHDAVWLNASFIKSGELSKPPEYITGFQGLFVDIEHHRLVVFSGYPDPNDPAGIIVPYTIDGRKRSFRTRIHMKSDSDIPELKEDPLFNH